MPLMISITFLLTVLLASFFRQLRTADLTGGDIAFEGVLVLLFLVGEVAALHILDVVSYGFCDDGEEVSITA